MTSGTSENTIFRPVLLHPMLSNASLLKGTDSCDLRFNHLFKIRPWFSSYNRLRFRFHCSFSPLFKLDSVCTSIWFK